MKISELMSQIPIGEVVTDGRVLYALKKRGLVASYDSKFKCLDGPAGNEINSDSYYIEYEGNFFESKFLSGDINPYLVKCAPPYRYDAKRKMRYYIRKDLRGLKGMYERIVFTDSLASCLYKAFKGVSYDALFRYRCMRYTALKNEDVPISRLVRKKKKEVNRSMSLWGSIC